MTSNLHHYCLALCLLATCPMLRAAQEGGSGDADEDWAALLEEAESSADWAADPLADLNLFGDSVSSLLLTTSLRAGLGYSDNFLKRPQEVDSGFYKVEADLWMSWFMEKSTLSALFYGEANIYENKVDSDDEFLTFAQLAWSRPGNRTELGWETVVLFADQIYDASLSPTGEPSGTRIRQLRPETMLYLDWFAGRLDRLRADISIVRTEYNLEEEDYWEPVLGLEWERVWKKGFHTITRIALSRQYFDDALGRDANGIQLPEAEQLLVDRLLLEERLKWKPADWKWLELTATAGVAWDKDQVGVYESLRQAWISGRAKVSGKWGQVKLTARWREIRYDERQVDFFDSTPVLHTQRSLQSEYKLPLPWSFAVYLRGEWTRLDSRVEDSRYTEQRGEILFQWSY
ncbi:MAG: hypothetical protein AB3N64_11205 [Puniceicoccaceae bacterium]